MIFTAGSVSGAYVVDVEKRADERGYFARIWCERELAAHGLSCRIAQANTQVSAKRCTLRGLHYQEAPFAEVKFVRCARGAIYDVIVDLRRESPTFKQWMGSELSQENARMLYCPEGCAHGYLTLRDDTEVSYLTSQPFAPHAARGVRFDDLAFRVEWPEPVKVISVADRGWPDFES